MKTIERCLLLFLITSAATAQQDLSDIKKSVEGLKEYNESLEHRLDILEKKIDDVLWYHKVGDAALIDKVYLYGPPRDKRTIKNPTAMGVNNPVKFWAYIFIPKDLDQNKKYPLIVFPHGGIHSDFTTYYTHIIRELIYQQYVVVAADYRGSTGYGKSYYERIDYGGLEIEDVEASRKHMVDNYPFVDGSRTGIIGWSHGGLIALMNVFEHADHYKACFAGVPVSDLIARMGYYDDEYRALYSAAYHIGKTAGEDVLEYKKRSPAWNAHKLQTPLLIHTTTNDDDVNVLEVEHLIQALKAENKKFDYEVFEDAPGGHSFDRIDTREAREIRVKIYRFLDRHLGPARKITSVQDINRAAYFVK